MSVEHDEHLVKKLKEMLSGMREQVRVLFFTDPESKREHCDYIRNKLSLLTTATDKVRVVELSKGSREAERLDIPLYPAIVVHGVEEYNIRFFGTPAGYEFAALVEDVVDASVSKPRALSPHIAEALREHVRRKTRIKVFVTPTCPYCPPAVRAAHRFAMVNRNIYGDMIEVLEFPELANAYRVYAVPKVVIEVNGEDRVEFEGTMPDAHFAAEVLRAHGVDPGSVCLLPPGER